jgi:hypothetical protein
VPAAQKQKPAPQQPPQQPPPPPAALIAAVIAALATAVTVTGIVAALGAKLLKAGISYLALAAVAWLILSWPQDVMEGTGPATRWAVKTNLLRRAIFFLHACRRVQAAVAAARSRNQPVKPAIRAAIAVEQRYQRQQVAASQGRIRAASAVDGMAGTYGNLLGWQAVRDSRCSPGCRKASGSNFRADQPPVIEGSPSYPGAVHPNCFPAGTVVTSPRVLAGSARWYCGELVELTTDSGDRLSVTPNHPVLTAQGWVAAGLLDEGGYVVRTDFGEALSRLVDPDDHQVPALIEDVLAALGERRGMTARAVPVSAEDFHGDGGGSEVAVIRADDVLWNALDATEPQPRIVKKLQRETGMPAVQARGVREFLFGGPAPAANSIMSSHGVARVLLGGALGHHDPVGLGDAASLDSPAQQDPRDRHPVDAVLAGEAIFAGSGNVGVADIAFRETALLPPGLGTATPRYGVRGVLIAERAALSQPDAEHLMGNSQAAGDPLVAAVAGLVEFDRLVKVVKRQGFSGHVYSLETSAGWHITGSIITHNCRCYPRPPFKGAPVLP